MMCIQYLISFVWTPSTHTHIAHNAHIKQQPIMFVYQPHLSSHRMDHIKAALLLDDRIQNTDKSDIIGQND